MPSNVLYRMPPRRYAHDYGYGLIGIRKELFHQRCELSLSRTGTSFVSGFEASHGLPEVLFRGGIVRVCIDHRGVQCLVPQQMLDQDDVHPAFNNRVVRVWRRRCSVTLTPAAAP